MTTSDGNEVGEWFHGLLRVRWPVRAALIVVTLIMLMVVHGRILYFAFAHAAGSGAVAFGVVTLIVLKHLGVLGSAYSVRRRRNRP